MKNPGLFCDPFFAGRCLRRRRRFAHKLKLICFGEASTAHNVEVLSSRGLTRLRTWEIDGGMEKPDLDEDYFFPAIFPGFSPSIELCFRCIQS